MKKILLFLLVSVSLLGETISLGLEEAINLAYKNSYQIKNAELDNENMELQVEEAYKEMLPELNYSGSYSKTEEDSYGSGSRDESYSNNINFIQPIYRGGIIDAGIKSSEMTKELSDYQYEEVKSQLRVDVIRKYTEILKLEAELEVYKKSQEEVTTAYNRANKKYELKLMSKSEVLPFKTKVINIRTNIIEIENKIEIAKIDLKNEIKVNKNIELKEISNEKYSLELINIREDVEIAKNTNRAYKLAELDRDITEIKETEYKANFLPTVNLIGGYGAEGEDASGSTDEWEWNVGVNVEMNLFSFGQDVSRLRRSENETLKSENNLQEVIENTEVEVRSNYLDLVSLSGSMEEQKVAVESAEENYILEKKRYEKGLTDAIDFLAIENTLRETELELIENKLNYYLAYEVYLESLK